MKQILVPSLPFSINAALFLSNSWHFYWSKLTILKRWRAIKLKQSIKYNNHFKYFFYSLVQIELTENSDKERKLIQKKIFISNSFMRLWELEYFHHYCVMKTTKSFQRPPPDENGDFSTFLFCMTLVCKSGCIWR